MLPFDLDATHRDFVDYRTELTVLSLFDLVYELEVELTHSVDLTMPWSLLTELCDKLYALPTY